MAFSFDLPLCDKKFSKKKVFIFAKGKKIFFLHEDHQSEKFFQNKTNLLFRLSQRK